jgi:hypothetical protein
VGVQEANYWLYFVVAQAGALRGLASEAIFQSLSSLAPYMSHGGVIEVQLAKAGVRLATLLNGIWKQ